MADRFHSRVPSRGLAIHRRLASPDDVVPWEPGYARPGSHLAAYLGWQARRFRRCAAVIAVSRTVATEAIARLDLDPGHVHIVPEGVDEVFTADPAPEDDVLRRSAGVDGARYLLWVGSLVSPDPRKGLDVLLDALAGLDGAPRLVLVGRTGEAGERLTAEARSRGVPIHLTGWVDDAALAALYRGCAAVVVPSRHEGFGLPALEGMACGAPVIAATSGNLTELVGDAAMLVPPGDAAALRYALRSLLDDGTTRHRLARAGPPRAAPFRWERAAELTVAVYAAAQRAPAHPA